MESRNYKIWLSVEDERRCGVCRKKQGKLVAVGESEAPPAHVRCRCRLKWAEAKIVGTATNSGMRGGGLVAENLREVAAQLHQRGGGQREGLEKCAGEFGQRCPRESDRRQSISKQK